MGKKDAAAQIKKLIDAGDFVGAQALINAQIASPPKKRGRPPKSAVPTQVEERPIVKQPPPPVLQGCIAPSRRVDVPPTTVEKDGKTYVVSKRVGWTPPDQIKFTDDRKVAKNEMGLKYPERSTRRDPVELVTYICYLCDKKVELYPGDGPAEDMLYTCPRCLGRKGR